MLGRKYKMMQAANKANPDPMKKATLLPLLGSESLAYLLRIEVKTCAPMAPPALPKADARPRKCPRTAVGGRL
jgi:hypothetical protein